MKLQNRVALVTGGAGGIGRATALALAAEGAKVVVSDMHREGGEETVRLIQDAGGGALFIRSDVTRWNEVRALVDETLLHYGRLDCAVNNAGIGGDMVLTHEREESMWDSILDVNLKGVWLSMKAELAAMLEGKGGAIVNVSSASGLVGFRYGSAYAASKHGVIGLTRSAALEYARRNIRVNAVCPGFTDTPMVSAIGDFNPQFMESTLKLVPMRRLGLPEETARAILWLCCDDSSFVTGHALAVDGGIVSG